VSPGGPRAAVRERYPEVVGTYRRLSPRDRVRTRRVAAAQPSRRAPARRRPAARPGVPSSHELAAGAPATGAG
jgi:hypothetical protein